MKSILTNLLAFVTLAATAQIQTPQASSAGSVSSVVGLTDIRIDYSRPKMKGRKIFGDGNDFLTPYGKIWRTGANNGTVISFSEDVKVEGIDVPKGKYLIFTWPGATEWTVSLYKDLDLGGNTAKYDAAKEQARFKVKADKLADKVETLTFTIGDISEDNTTAKIQLAWETASVKFNVVSEYDSKVSEQIEENFMVAAHYYFNNKKDLKQALKWTDEYMSNSKHANEYWNINFKAQLQKALGDKAGAMASAQKSLELAKKDSNEFYSKQNEDLIKSLK